MTDRYRAAAPYLAARRSRSSSPIRPNWRLWVSGALLTVAIVFGGGGTPSPLTELIVELAALAAIAVWAWLSVNDHRYSVGEIDRPLYVITALFIAIPVLQLIPLPPGIWHNLPGREIEVQALALIGRDNAWMPWSMSPPHTIASALSLIPPIAMLFMVSRLRERDRVRLIGLLAALGLLAAVVGVVQLASGNANWLRFYAFTHYGFATGFQANRNADADVLLIATMALAGWAIIDGRALQSRHLQIVLGAFVLFLALSVVLTGSRTGVALLAIPIIASAAMVVRLAGIRNWKFIAAALLGVAVVAGGAYFLSGNARVQHTLNRFDRGDAVRPEIWKDTVYAIGQHWPAGSGVGTFQPVFAAAERLEFVRPDFSNRAHNDYLEFVLEAGIAAPAILIVMIGFAGVRLWRLLTADRGRAAPAMGILVLGSMLVLLFHSLVDYPERSLSLAVLTGLLGGLLGGVGVGRRRLAVEREVAG